MSRVALRSLSLVHNRVFRGNVAFFTTRSEPSPKCLPYFHSEFRDPLKDPFLDSFTVMEDFITESEEGHLLKEVEPHLKRMIYEQNHWDQAIIDFRETEKKLWNKTNTPIIDRLKEHSFSKNDSILPYVHVLDLAETGYIKPHIDSTRFCGNTVAVLSLLSDSVARFKLDSDPTQILDVLVRQRSLYIMKGVSRYEYTHEILGREESHFGDMKVPRGRRISIVCRNESISS